MIRLFIYLTIATLLSQWAVMAQTATNTASENRFLVVVETSRSMQRRSNAVAQALSTLLTSGFDRQARAGDTIGIWTYNERLNAGVIPLATWRPDLANRIAGNVLNAVLNEPHAASGDPSVMMPDLLNLVRDSDSLTAILVSSGETEISGTPFDAAINQHYNAWKVEQARTRTPFITVLQSYKGKITEHSVAAYPWPVDIPRIKRESLQPKPAIASATPTNKTTRAPAPLIITGKKTPETPPPALTNPVPAQTNATLLHTNAALLSQTNPPPQIPTSAQNSALKALQTNVALPPVAVTSPEHVPTAVTSVVATPPTAIDHTTPPTERINAIVAAAAKEPLPDTEPKQTNWKRVLPALIVLIAALGGLVAWFVARRSRRTSHESLITRSFDRETKP